MTQSTIRVVDVYAYRSGDRPRFLLLRRSDGRMYAGSWRMVGGKIHEREQAWQAAVRELWEETGHQPKRFWTVPALNGFYEWKQDRVNLIPVFAAELGADPVLDGEHDRFEWLEAEDACARLKWPEQQRMIRTIEAMLRRGVPPELEIPVGGSGQAPGA